MTTPSAQPARLIPQPEALSLIPSHIARAHKLLPLKCDQSTLYCAGPGPFDLDFLSRLQFQIGKNLTLVRIPDELFTTAFSAQYGDSRVPEAADFLNSLSRPAPKLKNDHPNNPIDWARHPLRVTSVMSASGGLGATTVAANLAVILAEQNLSVYLIDGHFSRPTAHIALGAKPTATIQDLQQGRTLAWESLTISASGVRLLAGEPGASDLAHLTYQDLIQIGAAPTQLAPQFDHAILDLPSQIADSELSYLQHTHNLILLSGLDSTSLHNALILSRTVHADYPDLPIHLLFPNQAKIAPAKAAFRQVQRFADSSHLKFAGILPPSKRHAEAWACRTPLVRLKPQDQWSKQLRTVQNQILPAQLTTVASAPPVNSNSQIAAG